MFLSKIVACKPCDGKGLTEEDAANPGLEHINPSAKPGGRIRGFIDCIAADKDGRIVSDSASGEFDANSNTEVEVHSDRPAME